MCKCTLEVGVIVADAIARILDRYEVPPMLSMEVAAEKLDVSKETLRSFINSGELPVVAVTDRIQRIKISDFNAFINGRMRKAAEPIVPAAPGEPGGTAAPEPAEPVKPVETAAPAAPPAAPAEAASEVGHDDAAPEAPAEPAGQAAPEAPVEPAAPAAPEAQAVERCTATHRTTGKRCVLAAGHEGKHKLEE